MEGNMRMAMDFYAIAFQYDSLNRELCFFLCEKYKSIGKLKKSLEYGLKGTGLAGEPDFYEYKLMGEIYLRLGKVTESTSYYKKAHAMHEEDREILYTLATIYEEVGDISGQVEILEKLIPLANYPERLVIKLARIYNSQRKLQELEQLYRRAWEETNQNLYGERLAGVYESLGLYTHFLNTYRELRANDPENVYYKVQVARTFITLGMTDSAFAYYRELAGEFPDKEQFVYTYATLLYAKGDYEEAKSYFLMLLNQQPENAAYHYYLGSIGEVLGDNDLAELEYNKAVSLNQDILEYWAKLGIFRLKKERYQEARKLFSRMVKVHDESAQAWYLWGIAYNRQAEHWEQQNTREGRMDSASLEKVWKIRDKAAEKFRHSLSLNKDDTRVLFELGVALERSRKEEAAIEVFKRIVELDSNDANALNYLGYMYVEKNQEMETAFDLIERALRIEPENGAFLDSKGWWYFKMKEYEKAREYIEKALATGMKDIVIIEHLALILEKLGDMESAREQWTLILKMNPHHKLANSKLN
jgi:tetratricopeptide (TPR) repeat protein